MTWAKLIGGIAAVPLLVAALGSTSSRDAEADLQSFGRQDQSQAATRQVLRSEWSGVYKMHRPGLRVRLVARGTRIVRARIWVLLKCSNGFEGDGRLTLDQRHRIRIGRDGRFEYLSDRYRMRIRAAGRLRARTITGFFSWWYIEGHSTLCGTGQPGKRALRFVARR